jgi:hypothetical protein
MLKQKEIEIVFETIDPLNNVISLSLDTWKNHILIQHPYLNGDEKKVKETVEKPNIIFQDKYFLNTFNYYSIIRSTQLKPFGDYLKVSVDRDSGNIKTAFAVENISTDGNKVYSESDKNAKR